MKKNVIISVSRDSKYLNRFVQFVITITTKDLAFASFIAAINRCIYCNYCSIFTFLEYIERAKMPINFY